MTSAISHHVSSAATWVAQTAGAGFNYGVDVVAKVGKVGMSVIGFLAQQFATAFNAVKGVGAEGLKFLAAHPQGTAIGLGLAVIGTVGFLAYKALHNRPAPPVVPPAGNANANVDAPVAEGV